MLAISVVIWAKKTKIAKKAVRVILEHRRTMRGLSGW